MAKQRSSSPVGRNASAGGSGHKVSAFASDRKARPTSSSRKAHPGTGGRKVQPASGCRQEPPTVSGRKASSAISDRKASPAAIDRKARPAASGHKARPAANSRKANPALKVSSAASDRKAPCPIMRDCGGCEWLGLPYRKQLKRKHAAMVELYEPLIGRFGWNVHVDDALGMGPSREAGTRHRGRLAACLTARVSAQGLNAIRPPAPMAKCAAAFCPRHPHHRALPRVPSRGAGGTNCSTRSRAWRATSASPRMTRTAGRDSCATPCCAAGGARTNRCSPS